MDPLVVALFLSVATGAAAAIVAWRKRPEPGATPLVALLVAQSWWSICIIFAQQAAEPAGKILWTNVSVFGVVVIPVAWLLFALAYTGRDHYLQPRYVTLLLVVPLLSVLIVLGPGPETLYDVRVLWLPETGAMVIEQRGLWLFVMAGYTYLLGLLGAIPLAGLLASGAVTFRRQSAALLVGILLPWVTNVLYLAGAFPAANFDPTPIAFSVSGVAYLTALTQHRLFGTSPAPTQRARQHLFDQMQVGAIVVDRNDNIVDCNDTFESLLGQDRTTILGTPADDWLPNYGALTAEGAPDPTLELGPNETSYDVTATTVRDIRDRFIGRVITFHDISPFLRQQQRLEVLNRLLRHNIRTETNIIAGYATELDGEPAHIIQTHADRIADFGEKGRTAVDLFDAGHGTSDHVRLNDLISDATQNVQKSYPVTVTTDLPDSPIYVAGVLGPVLENLIENAAEHTAGHATVGITAHPTDDEVEITLVDDGPGIHPAELAVLESGTETALEHGSGLGLWIVKWGVDIANGTIDFTTTDTRGTNVTITVPTRSPPSAADSDT